MNYWLVTIKNDTHTKTIVTNDLPTVLASDRKQVVIFAVQISLDEYEDSMVRLGEIKDGQ